MAVGQAGCNGSEDNIKRPVEWELLVTPNKQRHHVTLIAEQQPEQPKNAKMPARATGNGV